VSVDQPAPGPTREQTVTYTNWRGERAERRIIPARLWYGVTEWHPEPGWLLDATDLDKRERRTFALSGFDNTTTLALLPARPSRCGFMSLGRQCQLPPVHDGEDHKLDLTEPARPSPTDDDLSELRRHVEAMADDGLSFESAHAYQEARQALADAAPSLLAEIERLRGSEAALRRAFDIAHEAGDQLWADRVEMEAVIERLRARQQPTEENT
jgi:hypothetical protein